MSSAVVVIGALKVKMHMFISTFFNICFFSLFISFYFYPIIFYIILFIYFCLTRQLFDLTGGGRHGRTMVPGNF